MRSEELRERERVLLALNHRQTDRVPRDFWAVPEIWALLRAHFGADDQLVLERLGVDIRAVGPEYIGPATEYLPDGTYYGRQGEHYRLVRNAFSTYSEHASFPLADADTDREIRAYSRWPRLDWYDWDGFSDRIGRLHERYYIKTDLGGPFERAWALRGMERFFVDMALNPEIPHALMDMITTYFIGYITRALECAGEKIDMVYTYDDIASQNSLLMSPGMWDTFIRPYHERIDRVIKGFGKTIMYHSCGAIRPMIGRLIDLPIDVLNPLQPLAADMDLAAIKAEYGDRLSFHGAIDTQELLPNAAPDRVRTVVRETGEVLGRDGGYIMASAHYLQADTPLENILAMYDMHGLAGNTM